MVLTGTYSSWNKGDAAMELVAIEQFTDRGVDVVVSTPFPDHDVSLYGDRVVRCPRRQPLAGFLSLFGAWMWRATGRRKVLRFLLDKEAKAMADAAAVVDLSGDMLTDSYGPHVAVSHYLPILKAAALERPVILLSQSIGPFRSTKSIARWIIRSARLVTLRDKVSYGTVVNELGRSTAETYLTPDLAFLLPSDPGDGIVFEGDSYIGVSVSSIAVKRYEKSNPGNSLVDELAHAISDVATREGLGVAVFAHVTGPTPDKDDRIVGRELSRLIPGSVVVDADLDPRRIKGLIGRMNVFVGARMHANIAALSQGVPTLALSYSHKYVGIMATLGQQDWVIDAGNAQASDVAELLGQLVSKRESISASIVEALVDVRRGSQEAIELSMSVIDG